MNGWLIFAALVTGALATMYFVTTLVNLIQTNREIARAPGKAQALVTLYVLVRFVIAAAFALLTLWLLHLGGVIS